MPDINQYSPRSGRQLKEDSSVINTAEMIEALYNSLIVTDFATQTTLAAILAKIIAAPATEAKLEAVRALLDGTLDMQLTGSIPAGTAVMGKVGIDQTTPGTTNGVQVTGSIAIETIWEAQVVNNGSYVLTAERTPTSNAISIDVEMSASVKWRVYIIPVGPNGQIGSAITVIDQSSTAAGGGYASIPINVNWGGYKIQVSNDQGSAITINKLRVIKHYGVAPEVKLMGRNTDVSLTTSTVTTDVNAGASLTTTFTPAARELWRIKNLRVYIEPVTGAASGSHTLSIFMGSATDNLYLVATVTQAYNGYINITSNVLSVAVTTQAPANMPEFQRSLERLVATDGVPLVFVYTNNANTAQTASLMFGIVKEVEAIVA